MRSKKSKSSRSQPSLWKAERGCSEVQLCTTAKTLAAMLKPGDRVLLEGPMGAGKSTFARAMLQGLGVHQPPEGSPTFAIAHEYDGARGGVVHIDLYRLKSEIEIDEAGIPAYFWERELVVLSEWTSSFPEFERRVLESGHCWRVKLSMDAKDDFKRDIAIESP